MKTIYEHLDTKTYKRVFTFGCSFTSWCWPTAVDILATHYNLPVVNYGSPSSSNMLIAYEFYRAAKKHNFTDSDLIYICWSGSERSEELHDGQLKSFTHPSIRFQRQLDVFLNSKGIDISSYEIYDKVVSRLLQSEIYYLRDLCIVQGVQHFLLNQKINFIQTQMSSVFNNINGYVNLIEEKFFSEIGMHNDYIKNSYFYHMPELQDFTRKETLSCGVFKNNPNYPTDHRLRLFNLDSFTDHHPLPIEHLTHLENISGYKFRDQVVSDAIEDSETVVSMIEYFHNKYTKIPVPETTTVFNIAENLVIWPHTALEELGNFFNNSTKRTKLFKTCLETTDIKYPRIISDIGLSIIF